MTMNRLILAGMLGMRCIGRWRSGRRKRPCLRSNYDKRWGFVRRVDSMGQERSVVGGYSQRYKGSGR